MSKLLRAGLAVFTAALLAAPLHAQSTAANGAIEGVVRDTTGAALPGATVIVSNLGTGTSRTVAAGPDGSYRALLLDLGTYRVKAELSGFKASERTGLTLRAGQTAQINFSLEVGGIEEVVSVTAEAPVAEPGKIDLGRTIGEAEIKNLPLVSRNPYNFAFLQANVTGYENEEFGVPRINANGTQMRTNYQIDGNTNTEKDRAGLRLLPASEIMVREVKVITSGFAPEFGHTTGMVYNAITPSGSNDLSGSASFRFRRKDFSDKPFFLPATRPKPDTYVNNWTATLGGPIRQDKAHFYLGYEYIDRDLSADRTVSVTNTTATALGLTPDQVSQDGVIPAAQKVHVFLGKIDYQLSPQHKLTGRYMYFKNQSPYNIGGGLNTIQRATDFNDQMHSVAGQLISTFGPDKLNELRVQYATRHQFRTAAAGSGTGPAITVSGVANFGGPIDTVSQAGFDFNQGILQVIDNFTIIRGRHNIKLGFDAQFVDDSRENAMFQLYTFPNIAAYQAARTGANPKAYSTYAELVGNPAVDYKSAFYGLFIQDDFRLTSNFKLLYGLRYDLFSVPESRPFASNPYSTEFKVDKNNFAPRVGFSWTLDDAQRTVLRASTGVMYEPPLLNFYEDSIQRNGDPRTFSVTIRPTDAGAPSFPATMGNLPPSFVRPRQSIVVMDPDFATQYSVLTNVQLERALTSDLAVSIGFVNSIGRSMPVLIDQNLQASGSTLADGRPIFSTTRPNAAFGAIDMFQSIGESSYNAMTMTLNKRMSHGWQFQATYTLARGEDNAPLTGTYVVGSGDDRISDATNLDRDTGVTIFNQTHTLTASALLQPKVEGGGFGNALLNNNQLGFIIQANSGLPFNIRANRDLNSDGVQNDRPIGIDRNTGRLGRVFNVDARYVRFVRFTDRVRAEFFVEAKNIFNTENVATVNRVVAVDTAGNPTTAIPASFPGLSGYQQRQAQLGLKLTF